MKYIIDLPEKTKVNIERVGLNRISDEDMKKVDKAIQSCQVINYRVIKVVNQSGFMYQGYGNTIFEKFATGTKEVCFEAIKKDIIFNKESINDSGSRLIFVEGYNLDEDYRDIYSEISFNEIIKRLQYPDHGITIRLQANDIYSSIYEITYKICE